jgi:putative oxygen-independent coproporphyrinogen III oxidase
METIGLYIHFPYCPYKCHYCDFNSYAIPLTPDLEGRYLESLIREMKIRIGQLRPFSLASIFLGGGTPSLFSPTSLQRLLEEIAGNVPLDPSCEVTLEANPKTLTEDKIEGYRKAGVNRISVGIQSFKDRYLGPLGRFHSGKEAEETLQTLENKNLNFNADLMFGFPGQTPEEVLEDLKTALRFSPRHLSFYNLTLEEGTLFFDQHRKGMFLLPDNEMLADMYGRGIDYLEKSGYPLYEISNFARPGYESRHNLSYWKYRDYLGLGAGAVSFLRRVMIGACERGEEEGQIYGYRWTNPRLPRDYFMMTEDALPPPPWEKDRGEEINQKTAEGEFWMMGLRLSEGASIGEFERRFGKNSFAPFEKKAETLLKKMWLIQEEDRLRLTRSGLLFANDVVSEFLLD